MNYNHRRVSTLQQSFRNYSFERCAYGKREDAYDASFTRCADGGHACRTCGHRIGNHGNAVQQDGEYRPTTAIAVPAESQGEIPAGPTAHDPVEASVVPISTDERSTLGLIWVTKKDEGGGCPARLFGKVLAVVHIIALTGFVIGFLIWIFIG